MVDVRCSPPRSFVPHQVGGLLALAVALAVTTASVTLLGAIVPSASRWLEPAVLVTANVVATVAGFLLLRMWIAGPLIPASETGAIVRSRSRRAS